MSTSSLNLLEHHWKFLRARAVADEIAADRGYKSAARKSELFQLGFGRSQQLIPALVIPVWSVRGQIEGYQLRPDKPRLHEKGKTRKYEMRAGSAMLIDVHPRLSRRRDANKIPLIADPSVPLLITEGVPKADSAVSINLCCIALLGVYNFRGTNEGGGKTALADWESIALNGRVVIILFDSDVMTNPRVSSALTRLKTFLESRKATVKLVYLPSGKHGEKIGLDDYIAGEKEAGRNDAEIRQALLAMATGELRTSAKEPTDRPEILILPGSMPKIIDQAEKVLVANAPALEIFQRAGEIVRVITLAEELKGGGLQRPAGNVQLTPVSALSLQEIFEQLISWTKPDGETEKPVDCPARVAATYLARVGLWKLPVLTGLIEAPIMRADGSILSAFGYDESTGLFLCSDGDWLVSPESPTRADAETALRELIGPFAEFPFIDGAALVVFLAAILTAIQRRLLASAPLFAFDAPVQRSGKSLLAECIGLIATGRKPTATGVPDKIEEFRKGITSALREGQLIINLDNIVHPLDSPDLARAITQREYGDRLLGVNKMLHLPTNVLWTATGNNLVFRGDLTSRVVVCRINPNVERPEERIFKISDLPSHLLANRRRLIVSALTILRAYHVAGRPHQGMKPWGGFDQWSSEIRAALMWLGLADPCATRDPIIINDPDRELAAEVLHAWQAAFGDRPMLVREVVAAAQDGKHDKLKQVLLTVASRRDNPKEIDPRRLGNWCSSKKDRIIDGLRLTQEGKIHQAQCWRLLGGSAGSYKHAESNGETHTHHNGANDGTSENVRASSDSDRREVNSPDSPDSPVSSFDEDEFEDLEQ